MKQLAILLLLIGSYFNVNAQKFAIINDADGFVNVREKPNIYAAIRGKLYQGDIFSFDAETKVDWVAIYKQVSSNYGIEGYVHKTKIWPLSKLKKSRNPVINFNSSIATLDSLVVTVLSAKFIPKKHKLKYSKTEAGCKNCATYLSSIDEKHIWGTDGGIPKSTITSLKITHSGSSIVIPRSGFNDLYEPNLKTLQIFRKDNKTIFIYMNNSDGAGGYSVIWVIKNGKYFKRYLDNSEA